MKKFLMLLLAAVLLLPAAQAEEAADEIYTVFPPQKGYVTFTLPTNPSTGYLWDVRLYGDAVIESPGLMTLNDAIPVGEGSGEISTDLVGAPTVSQFLFTADHEGDAIVVFTCARPWEESADAAQTLVYLISVNEDGEIAVQDVGDVNPMAAQVLSVDAEERTALVYTETHGEVLVRFPESLALPTAGDRVNIWYNGVMALSLPGQINALGWDLVMTSLTGSILSVDEENRSALVDAPDFGEVLALFPENADLPQVGDYAALWYDGIMTRSLPPQITVAEYQPLTVYELAGRVLSVDATAHTALLDTENGEVLAQFPENIALPETDGQIIIGFNGIMTRSLPAQITVLTWKTAEAE